MGLSDRALLPPPGGLIEGNVRGFQVLLGARCEPGGVRSSGVCVKSRSYDCLPCDLTHTVGHPALQRLSISSVSSTNEASLHGQPGLGSITGHQPACDHSGCTPKSDVAKQDQSCMDFQPL